MRIKVSIPTIYTTGYEYCKLTQHAEDYCHDKPDAEYGASNYNYDI